MSLLTDNYDPIKKEVHASNYYSMLHEKRHEIQDSKGLIFFLSWTITICMWFVVIFQNWAFILPAFITNLLLEIDAHIFAIFYYARYKLFGDTI